MGERTREEYTLIWQLILIEVVLIALTYFFYHAYHATALACSGIAAFFVFAIILFQLLPDAVYEVPDYGLPFCPDDGVTHHENNVPPLANESVLINEYQEKGWSNITTHVKASHGLFGGHHHIVSAECPQAATPTAA